jgi:cyclopropane-fatty-acyl-phospholipid synthase
MNSATSVIETRIAPGSTIKPRLLDGLAKKILLDRLKQITDGQLIILEHGEQHRFGSQTSRCSLNITIVVKNAHFYSDIVFGGSIGAGEAYMADYWETDDLTGLIRLFVMNRHVLDVVDGGLSRLTIPLQKVLHWLNRNTQTGSRKNIAAHYDLGNEFFSMMLDRTMMYSSAVFSDQDMSLYKAQIKRLDMICQKLDLHETDHLLEIGTGWGGLSIHAAKYYGCQVTTTTISREQYELACKRVETEGLSDRITVLFEDYRDLQGQYDKLVSVEMIEAVGHQYYDTYFKKCSDLLKPDGMMLIQAITIADQNYEAAKNSVDFIQRYIFPGSCIPSNTAMLSSVTRSSDLRLNNLIDIGPHYATTLKKWRENIHRNIETVRSLGYSDEFLRMWEFYLCYCEGGFIERAISDVHMLFVKPDNRCSHLE